MPTPEKKVKQNVVKILTELGAYWFYPTTGGYGRSGVPDIVACIEGLFLAIECKAGNGKVTALQERELRLVEEANGFALIYREPGCTPETLKSLLVHWLKSRKSIQKEGTGEVL
jgi:hypothetical protein